MRWRDALIEGAWTYRMPARVSRKLHDRLEPLSPVVGDIAWKAQARLCARYRRLAGRDHHPDGTCPCNHGRQNRPAYRNTELKAEDESHWQS